MPLEIIAHNGDGPVFDTVEKDGILFTAQGTNVYVYDVSTDAKATTLKWDNYIKLIDVKYFIRIIKIDRNYLYVLTVNTLEIYDITNLTSPNYLSTYSHPSIKLYQHRGLSISSNGNFAYISQYEVGLNTVNITNKSNPAFVSTFVLTTASESNRPWRSVVRGNTLVVGTEILDGSVYKFDITNPSTPIKTGSWTSPNTRVGISGVAISSDGQYIIASEYQNGVWVINLNTMQSVGGMVIPGDLVNDVQIVGTHAYVTVRYGGYIVLDLSEFPIKTIDTISPAIPGYNEGIFITPDEGRVYLSASTMGFYIYNNLGTELVKVFTVGGIRSLAKKDKYLYGGCDNDNVWVFDVTVPTNPIKVNNAYNSGRNEQVAIVGNYLYVPGDWAQFSIWNISVPGTFVEETYRFGPAVSTVLIDGVFAYVSQYQVNKFGVYNISNPKNIEIISESSFDFAGKMKKYGKYVVASGQFGTDLGLHIIDVTNKDVPELVRTYMPGTRVDDVLVDGDVCYFIATSELFAVNLPDVIANASATPLSRLDWTGDWFGKAMAIDKINNRLYAIGSTNGSIRVIDIESPDAMSEIIDEGVNLPEIAYDILLDSDGLIYAAASYSGLYVIKTGMATGTGINVSSIPSGAQIFVDGFYTNKTTPDTIMGLSAGSHEIKLTLTGYEDYIQSVTIVSDQIINMGPVTLVAIPSSAPEVKKGISAFLVGAAAFFTTMVLYKILKKK